MASTPEYTRKAVDNYRKKFDVMQLRLPKGTKEIIDNKVGKANTHNFIVQCVLSAIELPHGAETEPPAIVPDIEPQEQLPSRKKAVHDNTTSLLQMQAEIEAKKAEQDAKAAELQQLKDEQEQQLKDEYTAELVGMVEKMRNGEPLEEDAEKEKVRQESIVKASLPY